jgi:hypothetical protein
MMDFTMSAPGEMDTGGMTIEPSKKGFPGALFYNFAPVSSAAYRLRRARPARH